MSTTVRAVFAGGMPTPEQDTHFVTLVPSRWQDPARHHLVNNTPTVDRTTVEWNFDTQDDAQTFLSIVQTNLQPESIEIV